MRYHLDPQLRPKIKPSNMITQKCSPKPFNIQLLQNQKKFVHF